MTPALASAILTAVEELVKLSPSLIADLQAIFGKPDPSAADWQALKDRVMERSYWIYVPDSDLTKPAENPAGLAHLQSPPQSAG